MALVDSVTCVIYHCRCCEWFPHMKLWMHYLFPHLSHLLLSCWYVLSYPGATFESVSWIFKVFYYFLVYNTIP